MNYEQRLQQLGLTLPTVSKPLAAYVPAVRAGDFVYTSGQLPMVDGALSLAGKVGADVSEEAAYEAAKICALNALAAIKEEAGSLDAIEQIVKLVVFVNSADGFTNQPKVANGASELMVNVFGDAGQHARSAVGANELPMNTAVEVELIVKLK